MGPNTGSSGKRWSKQEDGALRDAVDTLGPKNWKRISLVVPGRSDVQCLHRWQKVLRPGLVKGPWTKEEDDTVRRCIETGIKKWSEIASYVPGRIGKQCRERWFNHLDPTILKGSWTKEEDEKLFKAQAEYGNRWSFIATLIPGRTENAVKNRWNGTKRRRGNSITKDSCITNTKNQSIKSDSAKKRKRESESKAAEVADFLANMTNMNFVPADINSDTRTINPETTKSESKAIKSETIKLETKISKAGEADLAATMLMFASNPFRTTLSPMSHGTKSKPPVSCAPLSRRLDHKTEIAKAK
uniref:Uncharacterized protein n=1 Tax=Aplanochytrium stocchinoi TaxID=215587 RepID=A0A7S3LND3_9STRA|mmetsp:Transcript_12348/g.15320  ORF Transcript_12348/g.15320 Transcript_12348/m.15320 type:complete len:301 (+) Transcript_12348:17-919(+)|eukprot:CAMPEP_0204873918 /NCGR_PEP_ID=MMETSP1348-20121228/41915_1 /ASSEMBLY_ACC=CAM_ASM_000700 /TAXON_ID=215587 /ORGANISM="Aplanochytrium stocchinoi, Strain GSBS06" /LENGTH=300 /DNA_ID=CAMNT_0052029481 /DNA_START=313 /DNA_END=1215 /DNA_ORIENTATION=-